MNFLSALTNNATTLGDGLSAGNSLGGALTALAGPALQRSAVRSRSKVIDAYAEANARSIAKDMRQQRGAAKVAAAAGGGGEYGTTLAIFANNARASEENRQRALLDAENQKAALNGSVTTGVEAGLSFTSRLLGASAQIGNQRFKAEN